MKTRPTVRETGLEKHLGAERYAMFVERLNLGVPLKRIAKDIGYSEKWTRELRDVYHEEKDLHKASD